MIPHGYLVTTGILLIVSLGVAAWFEQTLPEQVPVHWNLQGQADRYGPSWQATWLASGILFGIVFLMLVLPMMGPFQKNFEQFRGTYGLIVVAIATAFLGLQIVIGLSAKGAGINIGSGICFVLGALFTVLGNTFGKIRRNFYVGIRTPWTLANDYVWERTHRLGGKLFVGVGLASIVAAVALPSSVCFFVLIGGAIGTAIATVAYSFVCYRRHGELDDLSEIK